MNVTRKDATIQNVGADDDFPGSFEVVLSTAAKDRDGDELDPQDWKQPLPDHITFDTDHGMSVATTVGSGVPSIEDGKLIVRGTYSSLPRAQETRTLVKEGHIRTTSVAFMSEKSTKDGKSRTTRELLNGAFVAIPSNREAVVLAAKSLAETTKAGARHSTADMAHIQAIHDAALALGASPGDVMTPADMRSALGHSEYRNLTVSLDSNKIAAAFAETQTVDSRDADFHAAMKLLADVDLTTLPDPVRKAIELLTTEDDTDPADPTEDPAPAAADKAAPEAETDDGIDLLNRLTVIKAAAAIAG